MPASSSSSPSGRSETSCRFCQEQLHLTFVDLGMSPLCESYVRADQLHQMEAFYPLHVYVCERCHLVQLQQFVDPKEIFGEYAYFSSYSESWLEHARQYTEAIVARFGLDERRSVVELASNDGYLLRNFVARGIPAFGIEPAANVAEAAIRQGVPTRVAFFGLALANELVAEGKSADLIVANNVLAQVPDLNDFVSGMRMLLKSDGVITAEVPHLLRLILENQFDTIYHEHFSYFSFITIESIFAAHRLVLFDVEELPSHGGSLRIYARHEADTSKVAGDRVHALRDCEVEAGLNRVETYGRFGEQVKRTKRRLLDFLIDAKQNGKSIAGYGAPGKGNTLLNYCGIRTDFLDYTVDRNPYKQGKFTPGTHIPILAPEKILETRPDYVLILPWNLRDEIIRQMAVVGRWGGKFVVPIPEVKVLEPAVSSM
ncbi:MAG: SAM-dependent methyltransferase [Acidobacteria bacterium RIFCSPLOWO2_12_FULL_65_11]|nr:MAG: SAM-dependent methyltransferase [Acidobacteria bacterium RIFCSPLOWO2_02_FULL_64_15]OFW28307.1 MAG: SAM-dependent methyltransferase [Acidobacteria bacterium RIFCSPLOWO2_12_FULL_65_11]